MRTPSQTKTLVLMANQLDNILFQLSLFVPQIIDEKLRIGSSSFYRDNIFIFSIDPDSHNFTSLRNCDFRGNSLNSHSPYISVSC